MVGIMSASEPNWTSGIIRVLLDTFQNNALEKLTNEVLNAFTTEATQFFRIKIPKLLVFLSISSKNYRKNNLYRST